MASLGYECRWPGSEFLLLCLTWGGSPKLKSLCVCVGITRWANGQHWQVPPLIVSPSSDSLVDLPHFVADFLGLLFFFFNLFYWSVVDWQCCGSIRCITKWLSIYIIHIIQLCIIIHIIQFNNIYVIWIICIIYILYII